MPEGRFLLTCAPGFEDVVARDALALGARRADARVGRVLVDAPPDWHLRACLAHPTAQKVHVVLREGEADALADVERLVGEVPWEDVFSPDLSFAVRALRVGEHPFTSIECARAGGDAVIARFRAATRKRPPVDLNAPDVEVEVEVHDREVHVGLNATGESLHRRPWRVFQPKAPVQATLASALVALSGWRGAPDGLLLDPLCGSGTILVEADHRARRVAPNLARAAWPFERWRTHDATRLEALRAELRAGAAPERGLLTGSDRNGAMTDGAARNLAAAGTRADLRVADVALLERPDGLTHVVTNPPWGLRITSRKVSDRIGAALRARLAAWARDGPLVAVVFVGNRRFEKEGPVAPAEARDVSFGGVACRALTYRL